MKTAQAKAHATVSAKAQRALGLVAGLAIVATAALLPLPAASAQTGDGYLEEIVVTAQKREQSLAEVPIAISVLGADDVALRDITSIQTLSRFAPNLRVTPAPGTATSSQIAIRGGVTINPALTWETTVGLYLDGVYIGKTQGSVFDVVDLERVEVLRGPQGTLYGRNTLAGAINLVTRPPSGEYRANLILGAGNYGHSKLGLSLDLPQRGAVRMQLAARTESRDGWISAYDTDVPMLPPSSVSQLNDLDKQAYRLALDADLGTAATLAYRFDYSKADQASAHSQLVRLDSTFMLPLGGFIHTGRQERAAVDGLAREVSRIAGHSLTLDVDLGQALSLRSITAHRSLRWQDGLDLDGSPVDLAYTQRLSDYDSTSQEVQLLGSMDGLEWIAGLYYFEDDGFTDNPQSFFGAFRAFMMNAEFSSRYGFTTEAYAVFGQLDWRLAERLSLVAGLRYTEEEKSLERYLESLGGMMPAVVIPEGTDFSASFDDVTANLALSWDLTDAITGYVKASQGWKSGGFNGEAQTLAETRMPYDSETVASYELGLKARALDNRLGIDLALFQNTHEDMQLSIFTAQDAAASNVRNAAEAQIEGAEVEVKYAFSDRLELAANYGLLDAEYKAFNDCHAMSAEGVDVADNRALPHAPKGTLGMTMNAVLFTGAWGQLRLVADHYRVRDYHLYPYALAPDKNPACPMGQLAPNTEIPGYELTDLRLHFDDGDDAGIAVTLWVNNLSDRKYIANKIDFGPMFGSLTTGYFGQPRTYGMDVKLRF